MVPFTSKCSQKRWRLGLRPRPPIARESGRTPSALASLTRKIENGVNAIQKRAPCIYSQLLQSPKSVGDWGSTLPHSDGERLCACQSGTPKGGAPIPIFAPGARNPRYATVQLRVLAESDRNVSFDENVKFEIGRNEFISPESSSSILAGWLWISYCLEKCLLLDSSAHVTNLFLFPLPPPPRLPHYPVSTIIWRHLRSKISTISDYNYLVAYKRELFEHRTSNIRYRNNFTDSQFAEDIRSRWISVGNWPRSQANNISYFSLPKKIFCWQILILRALLSNFKHSIRVRVKVRVRFRVRFRIRVRVRVTVSKKIIFSAIYWIRMQEKKRNIVCLAHRSAPTTFHIQVTTSD